MNYDMNTGMKKVIAARSLVIGCGIGGAILIGMTTSWWAALGVFLMLFGNNIDRRL